MSNTSQFDVATAALEHLELLNHSNQNPLEIAAQFRTLLRSNKPNIPTTDYTYTDYISADATIRRHGCFCKLADHRSKSFNNKIQYNFDEDQSLPESYTSCDLSKYQNIISSTEDSYPESTISSDSSELPNNHKISTENLNSNHRLQYPTVNWKQLREKQIEAKLNRAKEFLSTTLKTNRLSQLETTNNSTLSSLTNVSDRIKSYRFLNPYEIRKNFEENNLIDNSFSHPRSTSSSPSIRTPSISPIDRTRPTYTISRLNSTLINHNNDEILVPIADCNLIIKHKANIRTKRLSYVENLCNENELPYRNLKNSVYI
ncbi:unnamed protein product [Adineta steineri]|uniref:Uncharacterized protein n=1 Tax=Adineta steineri TaxID=433720 RepID=A0A814MS35_9BILA|nr:unnamed protein product [Adineta steineri]CAF1218224.1 unnamed protein product [Adineta steineri]